MASIYKTPAGERAVRATYAQALERWPVPHETLRLSTREGETFVLACGPKDKPPLILLHGSGANAAMWMGDAPAWSRAFRLFAVDIIGEPGFSAPSRPPYGSDAYALWLDDVLEGLGLTRAAFMGASLGGWFALDYATRRPERVTQLVLICPGGIGRTKTGFLLRAALLMAFGAWGRRKAFALVAGAAARPDSEAGPVGQGLAAVFQHFRPRRDPLPSFTDAQLSGLRMPVMLVVGGKDVMLDSEASRRRLKTARPDAEIRYLPEAGHVILGQAEPILDFLTREPRP